jgi:hypothetical protein
VPARVATGVQLGSAVLAGIGAAALLRLPGRRLGGLLAALLVLAAATELLLLPRLRAPGRARFAVLELEPPAEAREIFERLEAMGDHGPLLELPVDPQVFAAQQLPQHRILLAAYHHRRTSACFGSLRPPGQEEFLERLRSLGSPESLEALRALGFTTILADGSLLMGRKARSALERADADPAAPLRLLHANERYAAFALEP